jgi:hypothetical protein
LDALTMPDSKPGTLYTIGYGKFKGSEDLRTFLADQGLEGKIDTVIDVRYNPTGRNPLWRKGLVPDTIMKAGIPEYIHSQALGNPDYASGKPATRVVNRAAGMATLLGLLEEGKNVALMCVCQETAHCHRRLPVGWAQSVIPGLKVVQLEIGKEAVVS